MFDPIAQGLTAVSTGSVYAPPMVFLAGAVTSVGPCAAPRFIAVAGLSAGKSRRQTAMLVVAFIVGLIMVYAAFGAVSSLLGEAVRFSAYTYIAVAAALAAGGFMTLWRGQPECVHSHACARAGTFGGAVLLGASFALVVSPCCTPLVLGILAYTAGMASAPYASALLACFALGHALPVIVVALGTNRLSGVMERYGIREAAGVVSATLMLYLAGYYAVLA